MTEKEYREILETLKSIEGRIEKIWDRVDSLGKKHLGVGEADDPTAINYPARAFSDFTALSAPEWRNYYQS